MSVVGIPHSSAQQAKEGIGISPTFLDISGDPGQELKGQVTVINQGSETLRYKVYASDFKIKNEAYEKDFEPSPNTPSPVSWISLPQGPQELKGGGQATLNYSIKIPQSAVSRGYYGVIFAETLPSAPDATGVLRVKRVGTLLYLGVKGGLVQKGTVADYKVNSWQKKQPVTAELRLLNDGNIHLNAKGEVRLKNIFGKVASTDKIEGTLLPATTRKFSLELPSKPAVGIFKVAGTVDYGGKKTDLPSKWVMVLPPVYLVVLLLGAMVIIAVIIARRHVRNKK